MRRASRAAADSPIQRQIMNESIEQWSTRKQAVSSSHGVVAAQDLLAARAGADMLARGGNAVDAAVACALALGVVEPWMCGLGGSGYMVVWLAEQKRAIALDFQGQLAQNIDPADYPLDPSGSPSLMGFPAVAGRRNVAGYGSIAVPGALAGLSHALQRFGTLGLDTALKPAIQLADGGLPVNWFTTLQIALAAGDLLADPMSANLYMPGGIAPPPEQYLPLRELAATLRTIASEGPDSLYGGALGESMVADLQRGGSRIALADLADYQVLEFDALAGPHRGATLHTAGPTSGGPRLLEALAWIAERLPQPQKPDPHSWNIYADALNAAWRSHNTRIGRDGEAGGCTSHLSTVDRHGNMVALTYTLLNRFGARVILPGSGIAMNNAVSYFDPRAGLALSMQGGKRINASNMCPTIATRDDQALFAIGASGANYIMPCTTQIAALMLDFNYDLEQAFNSPRLDASDRGSVRVDPRLGGAVINRLGQHFELEMAQALVFPKLYACPSGVSRDPLSGRCSAMTDPTQPIGGAAAAHPFDYQVSRAVHAERA